MPNLLIGAVLIPLMSFLPGFLSLRLYTPLKNAELAVASFGISFLFFAVSAFSNFLFGLNQTLFNLIVFLCIMAYLCYAARRRRIAIIGALYNPDILFFLGAIVIFYIHLLCFQAMLPSYNFGAWWGDWWMHYDITMAYTHGLRTESILSKCWLGKDYFFTRTPLFHLVSAFFLSFMGSSFWAFQVVSSFLSSCFLAGILLIVDKLFNRKFAKFCLILFIFNPWIAQNALYTWPKLFCSFFILISFYFYLKCRITGDNLQSTETPHTLFLAGLFSGLAYMSHQMALWYIGFIILDLITAKVKKLIFFLPLALVILPWHIWVIGIFGMKRIFMHYLTYNTSGLGIATQIKIMCFNTLTSVIPFKLFLDFSVHPLSSLYAIYNGPLLGAITVSATLFIFIAVARHILKPGRQGLVSEVTPVQLPAGVNGRILLFIAFGFIGGIAGHRGYVSGIGILHSAAVPSVLLLLVYVFHAIYHSKARRFIAVGNILEFCIVLWGYVYFMGRGGYLTNSNWLVKKKNDLVFLNDFVGGSWWVFFILAVAIEVALLLVLVRTTDE